MLRALLLFMALVAVTRAGEAVILLHGLARTSASMVPMETALSTQGFVVINVDYFSREQPIAATSESVIGGAIADPRLRDCSRIHFVTHSLGGILVRSYFSRHNESRLGRVVMLGPPNQGSEVVDRLKSWRLFQRINGPAGSELGTTKDGVPLSLGRVTFELGVIAGDRTINWINSLMIPGSDDGKVSVERTKVDGMKEHMVVPVPHPFLMRDQTVIEATIRFLASGSFARRVAND